MIQTVLTGLRRLFLSVPRQPAINNMFFAVYRFCADHDLAKFGDIPEGVHQALGIVAGEAEQPEEPRLAAVVRVGFVEKIVENLATAFHPPDAPIDAKAIGSAWRAWFEARSFCDCPAVAYDRSMRTFGWPSLRWLSVAVIVSLLFLVYDRWREGYPFHIPGIGTVHRFPCSSYRAPTAHPGLIQAFGVIDGAALAARANDKGAVTALVDVVFDRLLPATRCGNSLRHRVADAEMRFRRGLQPSIAERGWSEAANDVLEASGAPRWARTSVAQLHLLREGLRPELPRFIGTVESVYHLSDQLSPVEAAFLAMELGNGVIYDPDSFRNGPDVWVEQVRAMQANPPTPRPPRAVFRVGVRLGPDLERELNEPESPTSRSVHRFLDHLGFPP